MDKYSKMGLSFLAGAAAGAITGVLLAPCKGSKTRKKMADKVRDWSDARKEKAEENWKENHTKEKFAEEPID